MYNPFLIIGYERSGTTLVRRLVSMHPQLKDDIVHENRKTLLQCGSIGQAMKKLIYPSKQAGKLTGGTMSVIAGQKIPYVDHRTAEKVISHFKKLFNSISIIHIVRDPVGAINSQVKTFNRKPRQCVRRYFASVPWVRLYLSSPMTSSIRSIEISYEELVGNPIDQLSRLYAWMGQSVKVDDIERIITEKDPWQYVRGKTQKMMCGLRYFDSIKPTRSKIVLSKDIIRKIDEAKKFQEHE